MKFIFYTLLLLFPVYLLAQQDSIKTTPLKEVILNTTKLKTSLQNTPLAISYINVYKMQGLQQQLGLNEFIKTVPGLFTLNSYNFNQDLRISIRGFGSRAAFGIRGLQIIVDGIPETTPDGQSQLESIPLGLIDNIEVIRGPSGSLYGNVSGGVINITTLNKVDQNKGIVRIMSGSYGMSNLQTTVGLKKGKVSGILFYNHIKTDGYRDYSQFRKHLFNSKINYNLNKHNQLYWQFTTTHTPESEDPGALTIEEVNTNSKGARSANVNYKTAEKIDQLKTNFRHILHFDNGIEADTYAFYANRDYSGKLPFKNGGISAFKRNYYGVESRISLQKQNNKIQLGLGYSAQEDRRKRYDNLLGETGNLVDQQTEIYTNTNVCFLDSFQKNNWVISGGIRFDHINEGTNDNKRLFNVFNPSAAVVYKINKKQSLFVSYATSFETPTLSELSNSPDGNLSFNASLEPIRSNNIELGFKHFSRNTSIMASIYHINTSNEIIPYELQAYPQRQFYKNQGKTNRTGFELQWNQQWKYLSFNSSYTYANYVFENNESNSESKLLRLPGIPTQNWINTLEYHTKKDITIALEYNYTGEFYADNNNTTLIKSYNLMGIKANKKWTNSWASFTLLGGINNLLNKSYFDNIRINAISNRYYEPAPLRNYYLGLEISL